MPSARRRSAVLAGLLTTATACAGAGSASTGPGGERLKVVATTTQVADFARNVGGDKIKLTQILKPNVDPHDYEPSPADIQAIAEADVVVENGVGLEKWLDQTIRSAGFHGTLVDASRGVPVRRGNGSAEEATGDPHIWHDPRNAETMSRNIATAFEAKDAAGKAAYEANLTSYTGRLERLDSWIAGQIDTLPAARRKLVTNHDAFGYYVDRYHLTFVGSIIPSFDTSAELSGRQLGTLVAKIKATGVTAIFSESSLPPKTAEAIGREAGIRVEAGENSLYGDTLGPAGSAGATYLDMERHNTTTIVDALRGRPGAPPRTAVAVAAGAGSGLVGVLVSTRYDVAAGGAVTVVTGLVFAVSLAARTAMTARRTAATGRDGYPTRTDTVRGGSE